MGFQGFDLLSTDDRRALAEIKRRARQLHEEREAQRPTLRKVRAITVRREHISLIQRMNFCEVAGEGISVCAMDPKRPYGNSDVMGDLAEAAGLIEDGDFNSLNNMWSEAVELRLAVLHVEAMACLTILANLGECAEGMTYIKPAPGRRWERADG